MDQDPDYDNMNMVRMAIVERGDRLVILMPPTSSDAEMETFLSNYENIGWPTDRVLVFKGPQAFAVLKDEKQADSPKTDTEGSRGICSHGEPWDGMSYTHFAIEHKVDHP